MVKVYNTDEAKRGLVCFSAAVDCTTYSQCCDRTVFDRPWVLTISQSTVRQRTTTAWILQSITRRCRAALYSILGT